jgi:hypothetical protein
MTLQELLDELRHNILHDRSDRVAGVSDRLWSDETLIRYINEAQKRFARLGLVLRDSTTAEVTTVTLATNQTTYLLHPSVIGVVSAKFSTDAGDLARAGHAAFGAYQRPDAQFYDPSYYVNMPPGKPLAYSTDEEIAGDDYDARSTISMRVYPAPSADYNDATLRLRVVRLPLEELTPSRLSARPEIPEVHHIEMLDWAAYLALRIVDVDAGDPGRAHEFRSMFENHVAQARRDALRKMFTPLMWGFGRNGFSWEK